MFSRLAAIGLGSGRLLRAEGEGLLCRAQRTAGWIGVGAIGGITAAIGLAGLIVAGTAWIANMIGWIPSVAIAAALTLVIGAAVFLGARSKIRRSVQSEAIPRDIEAEREIAKMQIKGQDMNVDAPPGTLPPSSPSDRDGTSQSGDWQDTVAEYVKEHPGLVAGGALCALAAFGPMRSIKLLSRGMMVAGLVSSLRDASNGQDTGSPAGTPRPTP